MDRHRPARPHYAWVILAVTGLTVVMTSGVTAVPAVLIHPLEVAFGWDRAAIALAVSINIFLYGLAGPFAGRVMLRVTVTVIKRTMRMPAMNTAHMVLRVRAAESSTTFSLEFMRSMFLPANSSSAVSMRRMSSLNGAMAALASPGDLIVFSDICCVTDLKPIV